MTHDDLAPQSRRTSAWLRYSLGLLLFMTLPLLLAMGAVLVAGRGLGLPDSPPWASLAGIVFGALAAALAAWKLPLKGLVLLLAIALLGDIVPLAWFYFAG